MSNPDLLLRCCSLTCLRLRYGNSSLILDQLMFLVSIFIAFNTLFKLDNSNLHFICVYKFFPITLTSFFSYLQLIQDEGCIIMSFFDQDSDELCAPVCTSGAQLHRQVSNYEPYFALCLKSSK